MSNQVEDVLNKVQEMLVKILQETGFGHIEIDITKSNNKIQLIVKSGISYKYVINVEDLSNSNLITFVSSQKIKNKMDDEMLRITCN